MEGQVVEVLRSLFYRGAFTKCCCIHRLNSPNVVVIKSNKSVNHAGGSKI